MLSPLHRLGAMPSFLPPAVGAHQTRPREICGLDLGDPVKCKLLCQPHAGGQADEGGKEAPVEVSVQFAPWGSCVLPLPNGTTGGGG